MVKFTSKGSFANSERFLNRMRSVDFRRILERYGPIGVQALASATPVESGLTAESWFFEIVRENGRFLLVFHNSNRVDGVPIAIILQYGHGTRNGGWVAGRDYINPAIQPIFDRIAEEAWGEVSSR